MKINSKKKGDFGERELVKILNLRFGEGKKIFSRTPYSGAWIGGLNKEERQDMSEEQKMTLVSDIMTPTNFKYTIEHKFYKKIDFYDLLNEKSKFNEWIEQTNTNAQTVNKEPLLIIKTNNKKRIVLTKNNPFTPKFTYYKNEEKWNCYWLEDFLTLGNEFFFIQ